VNLDTEEETLCNLASGHHAPLDPGEIIDVRTAFLADPIYLKTLGKLKLPSGATIVPQGWPFGSDHPDPAHRRIFFILYHRNPENDHPDSNHYAFPLPVVLFWDLWEKKVTDVYWCYTCNEQDGMTLGTGPKEYPTQGCRGNDYLPELTGQTIRTDLKTLHVIQPEGVSFQGDGTTARMAEMAIPSRFQVGASGAWH
jgi:primary-amine oxidase